MKHSAQFSISGIIAERPQQLHSYKDGSPLDCMSVRVLVTYPNSPPQSHTIEAWKEQMEDARHLRKGQEVRITGNITAREYQGQKGSYTRTTFRSSQILIAASRTHGDARPDTPEPTTSAPAEPTEPSEASEDIPF